MSEQEWPVVGPRDGFAQEDVHLGDTLMLLVLVRAMATRRVHALMPGPLWLPSASSEFVN